MAAGEIRAGKAYVELGVRDRIGTGLARAQVRLRAFAKSVGQIGNEMRAIGRSMALFGVGMTAPIIAGVKSFATLESQLAKLRAAANPTIDQFERMKSAINALSEGTGTGPSEVAGVFGELLKAGLSVEQVIDGAAEATLKFARIGELDVEQAATVMADAMNVFAKRGMNAIQVVNTLSAAADASSVNIQQVRDSFSQASAVAGAAGVSLEELSAAIALLGSAGLKGSDAGTSLRTFILSLIAPTKSGAKVIKQYGLEVRNAAGELQPMRDIIAQVAAKLGTLDEAARDQAMKDLFGTDALRAGLILAGRGADGWDAMTQAMRDALPVAEKFAIVNDTMEGGFRRAWASLQRLGAAVGEAISKPLRTALRSMTDIIAASTEWVEQNRALILAYAAAAVGITATGAALFSLGVAFKAASLAMLPLVGGLKLAKVALAALLSPVGLVSAAVVAAAAAFVYYSDTGGKALAYLKGVFADLADAARKTFAGISDALAAGDVRLAAEVLWKGLRVAWLTGISELQKAWSSFKSSMVKTAVEAFYGVLDAWAIVSAQLKKGWANAAHAFESVWWSAVREATKAFDFLERNERKRDKDRIKRLLENPNLAPNVRSMLEKQLATTDQQADQAKAARDAEDATAAAEREADLQRRLAEIESERDEKLKAYVDAERALKDAADANSAEDIAAAVAELDAAKAALDAARLKASQAAASLGDAASGEPAGSPPDTTTPLTEPGERSGEADSGISQIGGKNAEFTLGGRGLSAQEETAQNTREIARSMTARLRSGEFRSDTSRLRSGEFESETSKLRKRSGTDGFFSDRVTGLARELADVVPAAMESARGLTAGPQAVGAGTESDDIVRAIRTSNDLLRSVVTNTRPASNRYT